MITLSGISKRFGNGVAALHGVDLAVGDGEFVALLGPSGSGKTTLLRIIAGLEFPDAGTVQFDGVDVGGTPVAERRVGFVFQHYALFRHMTVGENVGFGLSVARNRRPAAERRARAEELLRLVQLDGLTARYPAQLSGGQRQRVALARALAIEPRLLLLDEPFGALDAQVRKDLRRTLRDLHRTMGLTSVFVTHDQEEAMELADRVVVMNRGRIEQAGSPEAIHSDPATPFVSAFVGETNVLTDGAPGGGVIHARPHELALVGEGGRPMLVEGRFLKGAGWRIEARDETGVLVAIDLPAGCAVPAPGDRIRAMITGGRWFSGGPEGP